MIYVPDNPLSHVLRVLGESYSDIATTLATREEEAFGIAAGLYVGGVRPTVMLQSSGLGNCVNMLSLARTCHFPLLMFITMRGEWEEFNPWQVPMGSIVEPVLKLCETQVYRVRESGEVEGAAQRAASQAFGDERIVAVLLSQQLIGKKVWTK